MLFLFKHLCSRFLFNSTCFFNSLEDCAFRPVLEIKPEINALFPEGWNFTPETPEKICMIFMKYPMGGFTR